MSPVLASIRPGLLIAIWLWAVCVHGVAVAAPEDEPGESSGTSPPARSPNSLAAGARVLLPPTSPWTWQVVLAPRLAPQIGALAVSGLDVAAGRATAPISVLGEGAAPAAWPFAVEAGVPVLPAAPGDRRIAAAFGVTSFALTAQDEGLAMLEIRLRYQDGVAISLNGVEVARRALPAVRPGEAGESTALASRPHGPEWETVYLPVAPGMLRLGRNVLALELHPSGRRDAPVASVELVGRRDRGILRGPVLAVLDATTATIAVETDPGTEATIEWGTGGTLDHTATSPPGRRHSFSLAQLPAHAQIHYRVHAGASQSPELVFHTAPAAGEVIRIGIYGDVRGGHAVHRQLVEAMLAEPLDLVAVTGDMVLRGSDEADWQRFFTITAPLLGSVSYLPAIGNHDLGWDGADSTSMADAEDVFTLPAGPVGRPAGTYWYSYDLADVHLVFLDSNAYERLEQERWLEADLAAARARKVRAILAITHDGPYSRGYHRGSTLGRTRYVPILARYHVDYVMSGHDHLYQRGEAGGIRYVVSGGGGASLYAVSCGIAGKPACRVDDGMVTLAREHHYLVLTISAGTLELCARRPDGRLLEPCSRSPLWRR